MNHRMTSLAMSAALAVCATISGCGGGGGGGSTATADPQGYWETSDHTSGMLLTPGGQLWGVDGSGSSLRPVIGTVSTSGDSISGSFKRYTSGAVVESGTLSGSVSSHSSINARFSVGASTSQPQAFSYDARYTQPAAISAISGSWTIGAGSMSVLPDGQLTGSVGDCQWTGTVSPDESKMGFFRVAINFLGGCTLDGQAASGVLVAGTTSGAVVVKSNATDAAVALRMSR